MKTPLRILFVEDSEDDVLLLVAELRAGGFDAVFTRVETKQAMIAALDQAVWDLVIADCDLPHFSAQEALGIVTHRKDLVLPFIVISGHVSEAAIAGMINDGAQDYLMKGNLQRLCIAVARVIRDAAALKERREVFDRLLDSEARFRGYFESSLYGIAITSPEKGWIEVNDKMCSILGYTRGELLSRTWSEMTHPDDLPADSAQFQRLRSGLIEQYEMEKRFIRKDGIVIWTDLAVSCVRDDKGGVKHVLAIVNDITVRKQTEAALREITEYLESLINYANAPIIVWDPQFRITRFNHAFELLVGRRAADVIGGALEVLFPAQQINATMGLIQRTLSGERWDAIEIEVQHADGSVRTVLWNSATIFSVDKALPIATIAQGQDITLLRLAAKRDMERLAAKVSAEASEQKFIEVEAAYKELKKTQEMLIQSAKMAAVGVMSAGVAHELNNPLTVILGISRDHVAQNAFNEIDMDDNKMIVEAGERMASIIKGLLDFSRLSPTDTARLDCNEAIEHVLMFARRIMLGSIEVQTNFEKDLPFINADKNRIEQVITGIMSNASDAMEKSGVLKISTRVESGSDGRRVVMEFTDDGCGISSEHIGLVFDPFFTTKRPGKGTGLGLAVANTIIREYHGEIIVESPPAGQERGASFKICLPVATGA